MEIGERARKWLAEKLGNPVMPSKEKRMIEELEEEERSRYGYKKEDETKVVEEAQESGEDYPAEYHRR